MPRTGRKVAGVLGIIHARLIPAFDRVGNLRGLPQSHAVQHLCDLFAGRRIRQSFVCDCADEVVPVRAVSAGLANKNRENRDANQCSRKVGGLHVGRHDTER